MAYANCSRVQKPKLASVRVLNQSISTNEGCNRGNIFISRYSNLLAIVHENAADVHLHVKDSS